MHPSFPLRIFYKTLVLGFLGTLAYSPIRSETLSQYPAAIHIKMGADSNLCGITTPSVKPAHKIGLIVWLHGGMRSANHVKGAEAHRAILPFINPKAYYLCSPSAFGGEDWLTPQGQAHIEALIGYMLAHYPIDSANINMVGVSDGTLGVIAYSTQGKRELRRRILISTFPQIVLPVESLGGRLKFATGTWEFLQGGQDRLFPVNQVLPYLKRWETLYSNAHLHFFPDGEHDFSFYSAHAPQLITGFFEVLTKPTTKTVKSK